MRQYLVLGSNIGLFLLTTMVFSSLQTSFWFQIFGYFPGPALWITCLVYVALHRSTLETIIYSYLTAFALTSLTVMPEHLLMMTCLALALSIQGFKRRFFWQAASYFMLVCGLAAFVFHLYHFSFTFLVGNTPISSPRFSDWLIEALLTPLVAPILIPVFRWFDKITDREPSTNVTAQVQ